MSLLQRAQLREGAGYKEKRSVYKQQQPVSCIKMLDDMSWQGKKRGGRKVSWRGGASVSPTERSAASGRGQKRRGNKNERVGVRTRVTFSVLSKQNQAHTEKPRRQVAFFKNRRTNLPLFLGFVLSLLSKGCETGIEKKEREGLSLTRVGHSLRKAREILGVIASSEADSGC